MSIGDYYCTNDGRTRSQVWNIAVGDMSIKDATKLLKDITERYKNTNMKLKKQSKNQKIYDDLVLFQQELEDMKIDPLNQPKKPEPVITIPSNNCTYAKIINTSSKRPEQVDYNYFINEGFVPPPIMRLVGEDNMISHNINIDINQDQDITKANKLL